MASELDETPVRNCPRCKIAMQAVRVPATSGYCLTLDQCATCGGVWCDRWELYPLSTTAVAELDPADRDKLTAPLPALGSLPAIGSLPATESAQCPVCRIELHRFTDPSLPADANLQRCKRCDGLWLNRGELRRFKSREKGRLAKPSAAGLSEVSRAPEMWPTVEQLDGATANSVESPEEESLVQGLFQGAAWVAGRLLLRWFLGL